MELAANPPRGDTGPLERGQFRVVQGYMGACTVQAGMGKPAVAKAAAAGIEVVANLSPWGHGGSGGQGWCHTNQT